MGLATRGHLLPWLINRCMCSSYWCTTVAPNRYWWSRQGVRCVLRVLRVHILVVATGRVPPTSEAFRGTVRIISGRSFEVLEVLPSAVLEMVAFPLH